MRELFARIYRAVNPTFRQAAKLNERFASQETSMSDVLEHLSALDNILHNVTDTARTNWQEFGTRLDTISRRVDQLQLSQLNLLQTVNMTAAQQIHNNRRIKVMFLIHEAEMWPSLNGVYQKLRNDESFDTIVVTVNRRYPGSERFSGEDVASQILDKAQVPHIRFRDQDSYADLDIMKCIAPDVIFRQSQWETDIPPAFSVDNLRFARLYNVPYEIMPLTDHIFTIPNGFKFWQSQQSLFVINDELAKKYKTCATFVNAIATGHPKVDAILAENPSWPIETGNPMRVFWSAHHSIFSDWNDFGALREYYANLLRLAKTHPEIDVAFSLHPAMGASLRRLECESPEEFARIDDMMSEWQTLPNTAIVFGGGYVAAMKASSLIVSDGMSILIEGQLTHIPILYLERKGHIEFSDIGEIIANGLNRFDAYADFHELEKKILYFAEGGVDPKEHSRKMNYAFLTEKLNAADNVIATLRQDLL